uniref:Transmembrane protein 215 n=1 Tax=Ficedula albicollis TaxID=59894 RepID=A0A803WA22_FICAL
MHMPASRGRTLIAGALPFSREAKAARGGGSGRPSSGGHQVGAAPPSGRAGPAASRAGRCAYSRLCGAPAGPGEDEEEEAEAGQVNPRGSCLPGRCCWKSGLCTPGLGQGLSPPRPPAAWEGAAGPQPGEALRPAPGSEGASAGGRERGRRQEAGQLPAPARPPSAAPPRGSRAAPAVGVLRASLPGKLRKLAGERLPTAPRGAPGDGGVPVRTSWMARTLRPDDINPRTGLVVALVSVFLVFGFMFTVSGIKGETLGDIPLLAIGPAICLPGIAAIALTRKTDGCTKCPENMRPCCKEVKDRDVMELLRTPSDLESGKGSCDELARKAYRKDRRGLRGEDTVFICTSGTTAATTAECKSLAKKVEQEEMLKYLESCYPEMPENVFVGDGSTYSALEKKSSSPSRDSTPCPDIEDNIFVAPKDSIIVCSYKDNSPYDSQSEHAIPTGRTVGGFATSLVECALSCLETSERVD